MLETERLLLRNWKLADLEPFAQLNACPHVCAFLPKILTKVESDQLAQKIQQHFDMHGFGLLAAEHKEDQQFIGFVGLNGVDFTAHFSPAIEIGWRLAYPYWNQGLATEAACAVRDDAFQRLKLNQLVSFTTKDNKASQRVMEKIGMSHDKKDDFDHPSLPDNHPLRPHVLYRLTPISYHQSQTI